MQDARGDPAAGAVQATPGTLGILRLAQSMPCHAGQATRPLSRHQPSAGKIVLLANGQFDQPFWCNPSPAELHTAGLDPCAVGTLLPLIVRIQDNVLAGFFLLPPTTKRQTVVCCLLWLTRVASMQAAVAYIRVSSRRLGRSGLGIEAQRAMLARFAESEDILLLQEFVEVESGKGADALDRRPQLAAALAVARSHRCPVIVAKLDRLSRDVAFISGLMAQRVPLHRGGARHRCRPLHAASLCGPGGEGAEADLGTDQGSARRPQGAGWSARQSH